LEPWEKGNLFKIAGRRSGGCEWLAWGMLELAFSAGAGMMSDELMS